VTAYQLTPVGPEGRQEERSREIEVLAYSELLAENVRLRAERAAARMRVLASIGRASPLAAALVERARVEVYGRLP
jgi:hypothetical protein